MDTTSNANAPSEGGSVRAEERWALLRLHVENDISLAAIARDSGTGLRTLERWNAAYRARGFDGLQPAPPRAERRHRLRPELRQVVEGLALIRPRNSVATIHRKSRTTCRWTRCGCSVGEGVEGLRPEEGRHPSIVQHA